MIISFFFLLIHSAQAEPVACRALSPKDSPVSIRQQSGEILKSSQVQFAMENMADFCHRNMTLRYLNSINKAPDDCAAWPLEKLEAQANKNVSEKLQLWQGTLTGTEDMTKFALAQSLQIISNRKKKSYHEYALEAFNEPPKYSRQLSDGQIQEIVANEFSKPDPVTQVEITEAFSLLSHIESNKNGKDETAANDPNLKKVACLKDAITEIGSCLTGLDAIQKKVKRYSGAYGTGADYSNLDLWKKFYSSAKYDEGLRLAALKIGSYLTSEVPRNANVFDDIMDSFSKSGMSKEDAENATWDTLGLIANGGSNTLARTQYLDLYSQKSKALGLIGIAMNSIDLKKEKQGHPLYSFPKEVSNSCNNMKPYHFWMSAYLARSLVTESKISPSAATSAVFIFQKGYQLMGRQYRNADSPNRFPILTRPAYDPAHQVVRMDLAFSAAGAVFGANSTNLTSEKNTKINIDTVIVDLLKDSQVVSPLNKEEAKGLPLYSILGGQNALDLWTKTFSPDSALRSVLSQPKK